METIRKIRRGFGDDATGITHIKEWYNRFKDGRTSVESNAPSGRSSTSRSDELIDQVLVMQDCRVTVRELAEEVRISTGSVHSVLTDDLAMQETGPVGSGNVAADNAPTHSSQLIRTLLVKNNIPVVRQAPYSPDMVPCDFWLFPPPENASERDSIRVTRRHYTEHDGEAVLHSQGGIPEMLSVHFLYLILHILRNLSERVEEFKYLGTTLTNI